MKFAPQEAFAGRKPYRLLPVRFRRLPWDSERVFVSSMAGDWIVMSRSDLDRVVHGGLQVGEPLYGDLQARHMIVGDVELSTLAPLLSQIRTRKAYLGSGPSLHMFVVSLRCHHSCGYCQVSRQLSTEKQFDMSDATARHAVDRLFEWPSQNLTVEFQGGEPLLHFDRLRFITDLIAERNRFEARNIQFVVATTLNDVTDEQLIYFKQHGFQLSTSLDGPGWLHNENRPRPGRDSYERTTAGIARAREALGLDAVSALTTLTRASLGHPAEIVEEYRRQEFHSIFLRPLSPYGFALKTKSRSGYRIDDFLAFYSVALEHILRVNSEGFAMEEAYARLLLSQLMTPFSHGYVDLRSPTGIGFGAMVYDYDGRVYPSDESRMLAAMGDSTLCVGRVEDSVNTWLASPAMREIMNAGVAEALPTCSDCAFVPMCGADPVDHYARQGDFVGHRPTSDFCRKQMGMFDLLMERWERADVEDRKILEGWANQAPSVPIEEAA
jgi:His-Xaa-Ser system radical SAM maturase HxsB